MGARITKVEPGSPARRAGIRAGDVVLAVNGHEVVDVLDYRFYLADEDLTLRLRRQDGGEYTVSIDKDEYADIGLEFSTYLMDEKRRCRNDCVFCFIDQLPPGLRETLYFKDDDDRLSFLMGNYITLTNLGEREVERVLAMHLSPVNISVHTTNPELRAKMMRNRFAGKALDIMRRFAAGGIRMNCQIVLCKGLNDGKELDRTLRDLAAMYPAVGAVAVVPVGLTRYRQKLFPLEPFSHDDAAAVLSQLESFGERFDQKHGTNFVFPADEFYLLAGRKTPPSSFYEEMSMLENGVGLMSMLRDGFADALRQRNGRPLGRNRRVSLATGVAAADFMRELTKSAQNTLAGLDSFVYAIDNRFFGPRITVAGLVTGRDLIAQLKGRDLGDELLIPAVMLRRERDIFLDDVSVDDVRRELGVPMRIVENDGGELLAALAGEPSPGQPAGNGGGTPERL